MAPFIKNFLLPLIVSAMVVAFFACHADSSAVPTPGNDSGTGGSLARFMIVGNFLYTVDNTKIKTISLANPADPVLIDEQLVANGVESIFNLGNRLFIGSSTGLFLYTFGTNGIPQKQGEFLYSNFNFPIYPCDPVVANNTHAFVTLNTAIPVELCRRNTPVQVNLLNIFNISDINKPTLVAQYQMENPQGVGLDGNLLFLCEQQYGLKVYDISNPSDLKLVTHLKGFSAHDVIPLSGLLLVVGPENVYQIDYSDRNNIRVISKIPIGA